MRSHSFVVSGLSAFITVIVLTLTSCSSDYRNVIPANSIAVMSVDVQSMVSAVQSTDGKRTELFKNIFQTDDISGCGVDFKERIYAFETPDGSLGMVACIADKGNVEKWLGSLANKGYCSELTKKKGYKFAVIKDNFVVGVSDNALLVMGPVVKAAQTKVQSQMIKYLDADDEDGITGTQLYDILSSLDGSMALVAQAQALPEKFLMPFSLGAPPTVSPENIYLAASVTPEDGYLNVAGEAFSFKKSVDDVLKSSSSVYRPISDKYVGDISTEALITVLCGIKGEELISQLHRNKELRAMLIGLNTVIDIDMMLKSIDGDMLMTIPSVRGDRIDFRILADSGNAGWLSDVAYWKKSTPAGSRIVDGGVSNSYCLKSPDMSLYFGLTSDRQLFLSTTDVSVESAEAPLPDNIKKKIQGARLCVIVNIEELSRQKAEFTTVSDLLSPVFGDVRMAVFSIK